MKEKAPKINTYLITVVAFIVAASAFIVSANWWTPTGNIVVIGANVDTSNWVKGTVLGEESDFLKEEYPDWKLFEVTSYGFLIRIPNSHEVVMERGMETEYGLRASETWQIAPKADAEGEYPVFPALISISVFPNAEELSIAAWHQKEITGWNVTAEVCRKENPTAGCLAYTDLHLTNQSAVFQEWFAVKTLQSSFDVLQTCYAIDRDSEVVKLCMVSYSGANGNTANRLAEEIGGTFEFIR